MKNYSIYYTKTAEFWAVFSSSAVLLNEVSDSFQCSHEKLLTACFHFINCTNSSWMQCASFPRDLIFFGSSFWYLIKQYTTLESHRNDLIMNTAGKLFDRSSVASEILQTRNREYMRWLHIDVSNWYQDTMKPRYKYEDRYFTAVYRFKISK